MQPTPKEAALNSIQDLPESATFEEIMTRIYELEKGATAETGKTQMGLWS